MTENHQGLAALLTTILGWMMLMEGVLLYGTHSTMTVLVLTTILAGGLLIFFSGILFEGWAEAAA